MGPPLYWITVLIQILRFWCAFLLTLKIVLFLKDLYEIEQYFGIQIILPEEDFTDERIEDIAQLRASIKNEYITFKTYELTTTVTDRSMFENVINYFGDNSEEGVSFKFVEAASEHQILHTKISGLQQETQFIGLVLDGKARLKRKLNDFIDGESVRIKFIPCNVNNMIEVRRRFIPFDNYTEESKLI